MSVGILLLFHEQERREERSVPILVIQQSYDFPSLKALPLTTSAMLWIRPLPHGPLEDTQGAIHSCRLLLILSTLPPSPLKYWGSRVAQGTGARLKLSLIFRSVDSPKKRKSLAGKISQVRHLV